MAIIYLLKTAFAFISIIFSLTLFPGYAELRDHVQLHGDGYKDPLANLHRSPGKSKQNQKKQMQANILNTSNESKDTVIRLTQMLHCNPRKICL